MDRSEASAFPLVDLTFLDDRIVGSRSVPGLTVREFFIAAAMVGLLAADLDRNLGDVTIANYAISQADTLLNLLERSKNAEL